MSFKGSAGWVRIRRFAAFAPGLTPACAADPRFCDPPAVTHDGAVPPRVVKVT